MLDCCSAREPIKGEQALIEELEGILDDDIDAPVGDYTVLEVKDVCFNVKQPHDAEITLGC